MNKRQFLARLDRALSMLNNEERKSQRDYYEEIINDMVDEGMSEETAVERMGSVQGIAAKILSEATPEQMAKKKKIGVLGWIGIVLGSIALIIAALCIIFMADHVEESGINVEQLDIDNWTFLNGDNIEVTPEEMSEKALKGIDIYWGLGNVTVGETDGKSIIVSIGGIEGKLLAYEYDKGVLYISSTDVEDKVTNRDINLKVLIPETMSTVLDLSAATADGDISVDCEKLQYIRAVTSSGDIRVKDSKADRLSLCASTGSIWGEIENAVEVRAKTSSGDITLVTDEDEYFKLEYATCAGDVDVSFDRSFKNESKAGKNGEAVYAIYDHSFGRADCMIINTVTDSGDIKLIDD